MASTYDFSSLSPYRFISTSGVVIPDTGDIRNGVVEMFKSVFGEDIDTTPETIVGRLIEAFTVYLRDTVGITAQNACQFNLNVATGIYLDALGALFGVARMESSRSSVSITMSGAYGTTVPSGTMFATRAGNAFYLSSDAIIGSGGTASGTALSMNYGPVECTAGDMISIVSAVNGLTSVTNASDASLGSIGESDNSYRNRIKSAIGGFGGSVASVYKHLYEATYVNGSDETVKSVRHALVANNGDAIAVTVNGITLAPHSIFVCVDIPSETAGSAAETARNKSIANAIAKGKSLGCGITNITNSISATADSEFGGITTYFFKAQPIYINVSATWGNNISPGSSDLSQRMEEIISGFGIGATITSAEVMDALSLAYPTLRVLSVTLNGTSSVSLESDEIGTTISQSTP